MQGQSLRIQKSVIEGRQLLLWQWRDRRWLNFKQKRVTYLKDIAMNLHRPSYQIEKRLLGQWRARSVG